MWGELLAALAALVLAFLPLLVDQIKKRTERKPPTKAAIMSAGHQEATTMLSEGLASGDGDDIAAAFAYNEQLLDAPDVPGDNRE